MAVPIKMILKEIGSRINNIGTIVDTDPNKDETTSYMGKMVQGAGAFGGGLKDIKDNFSSKDVGPNKRVSAVNDDIPAGTYSPSAFENLIQSFISRNGSRTVKNSFSVVVNGQTYSVSSGSGIYYTYQYSGQARFFCFNGSRRGWIQFELPSACAEYGVYCTYWSYASIQGNRYYMYSIKVNSGIKFE